MEQGQIVILVLFALCVLVAIMLVVSLRRRRSATLRSHFGPEYDRTLETAGSRSKAEASLIDRTDRAAKLDIRPLTPVERRDFSREWQEVKALFVDSPAEALLHADRLALRMLQARGFPGGDFTQRHEILTVNHPGIAAEYMAGRHVVERMSAGKATTEEMRRAVRHYEALVDDMIADISDSVTHRPITMQAQRA